MPHIPDGHWGAFCPKTGEKFHFNERHYVKGDKLTEGEKEAIGRGHAENYYNKDYMIETEKTMRFPNHDGSAVDVLCPKCGERHTITDGLFAPASIIEADQQELHDMVKLEELDARKAEAEARRAEAEAKKSQKQENDRIKTLERRLDEKDKLLTQKMGDLAESYLTLAKFINLEVPKLIAEAKGNRTNYETTHS